MTELRRLNSEGIQEFENYLIGLKQDPSLSIPTHLLLNGQYSEVVDPYSILQTREFPSRFELATYLHDLLGHLEERIDVIQDAGLWSWLTLYYFDQLCPAQANRSRKISELARYVPKVQDFRRYYRHLLAGPYRLYRAHRMNPDIVRGLLANPVNAPGEVFEQLAAVQGIFSAPGAVSAVTKLYFDPATGKLKSGAAGKQPGSARRLREFLNQVDLTWDLYAISVNQLLDLLPKEFNRFKVN